MMVVLLVVVISHYLSNTYYVLGSVVVDVSYTFSLSFENVCKGEVITIPILQKLKLRQCVWGDLLRVKQLINAEERLEFRYSPTPQPVDVID